MTMDIVMACSTGLNYLAAVVSGNSCDGASPSMRILSGSSFLSDDYW
jgi:hypothetical protein